MGRVMVVHFCIFLILLGFKSVFGDELQENFFQDTSSAPSPFGKLSLQDALNLMRLEEFQERDSTRLKRGKRSIDSDVRDELLENVLDSNPNADFLQRNPTDLIRNAPWVMYYLAAERQKQPTARILSPRLGRNANPSSVVLPPRFGKRNPSSFSSRIF